MNNNSPNPNQDGIDITIIAIGIFTLTIMALLGPVIGISPVLTAAITVAILAIYGIDLGAFSGRGTNFVLNWLEGRSPERMERILHHEAGHFLAAYLSGLKIIGYNLDPLSAPSNMSNMSNMSGMAVAGVEVDPAQIKQPQMLSRYCTVWMAGIAAEQYLDASDRQSSELNPNPSSQISSAGNAWTGDLGNTGGMNDLRQLKAAVKELAPEKNPEMEMRWALLRSRTLIKEYSAAYEALVEQMRSGAALAECYGAIDANLPDSASRLIA
ncbi:hypothetical protein Pse7367_0400 [Thalassoporum mexicanum PCC 7367]|uniref:hypothetical protein n=1 Tax=Thalassoporum mexicanum TaxID=3457544 RepID=UPI00029FB491|nr:hypothetical protein [Pseudanabaena sp. PCC 7367]AFY68711.1 hypothetical protein Pse7367_0400 [Pseudanabaena sp. PCC 7367]